MAMAKEKSRESSDNRIASLKNQDKEYNRMYRQWRIDHKDDYGFYFLDNSEELTYRNGEGFITEYPEAAERTAVNETHTIVGLTLIMYTALSLAACIIFTYLPNKLGHSIAYNSAGFFTGNEKTAVALSYIVGIVLRIIPMFFLLSKIRMPLKLILPAKPTNMPLFRLAIPMSMLIFGIVTIFSGFEYITSAFTNVNTANRIWIAEGKITQILSAVLSAVIIPTIAEIIYRGIFMNIFRQFGDGYALIVTSIICAIASGKPNAILFIFTYSLIIGYFTIRTGSLFTALLMRIVISGSSYLLTYIRSSDVLSDDHIIISLFIILAYICIGTAAMIIFMKHYSNRINLPLYQMYISFKEKILSFAVNPVILIWFAISVVYALTCLEVK